MPKAERLQQLQRLKDPTIAANSQLHAILSGILNRMETQKGEKGDAPVKYVDYFTPSEIDSIVAHIEARIRIPQDGRDGRHGNDGKDGAGGRDGRDGEDGKAGRDGISPSAEAIVPLVITELGKSKIRYEQVDGLPDLTDLQSLIRFLKAGGFRGGGSSSSAGASTILIATGAVDNANVDFTFTAKPSLVNVNGSFYREGHGWSWDGTTTATLDNPVGDGGDIFALT